MPVKDVSKEIKYLNKSFVDFRNSLVNHAKIYFPDSYNDFNETSLGMMFIEMSAYVGDVLSYYIDSTLKETMISYAEDEDNVIYLSQQLGYKYKTTIPAHVLLDVYQLLPATGVNGSQINFNYALKINSNMTVQSQSYPNLQFRTIDSVDFSIYDTDNYIASVYSSDEFGNPTMYLMKKTVRAVAGSIGSMSYTVSSAIPFLKITLPYSNVTEILDIYDDDGNRWYEVDYLSQDTIIFDDDNDEYTNNIQLGVNSSVTPPSIMKIRRVSRRFTTRRNTSGLIEISFGSGKESFPDEVLIPNPTTIKYNNTFSNNVDIANSYLNTTTYGMIPFAGTIFTIRYVSGGGVLTNVPQADLTTIKSISVKNDLQDYATEDERNLFAKIRASVAVSNPEPATGGKDGETIDEIRQNSMAYFTAQDRTVTRADYVNRALSMPAKYGAIPKVFVDKDSDSYAINIYLLGYDAKNKLTKLNNIVKQNLVTYLSYYRDLTTGINIKDAFIINIGVKFSIIVMSKYNKNEVLLKCIMKITEFFNINNWQIGQPIVLRDLYELLDGVEGVRSVSNITIYNKYDSSMGYSNNYYPIDGATVNGIIYTSADPSIFELKYPSMDIEGKSY